eukprot:2087302-Rhodomonas_salina.1
MQESTFRVQTARCLVLAPVPCAFAAPSTWCNTAGTDCLVLKPSVVLPAPVFCTEIRGCCAAPAVLLLADQGRRGEEPPNQLKQHCSRSGLYQECAEIHVHLSSRASISKIKNWGADST